MIKIVKKDGTFTDFDESKISGAINKSASRVENNRVSEEEQKQVIDYVKKIISASHNDVVDIKDIHHYVEVALDKIRPDVAESYRSYRNYKTDFVKIMDEVLEYDRSIRYIGDKENANSDSSITSTKRSLVYKKLSKEIYQKLFLSNEEKKIIKDGYVYIHDLGDRLHCSHNCCVVSYDKILQEGFEMSNVRYKPVKHLKSAFNVICDLTLNVSAQQYGGFTIANIDQTISPYAEIAYNEYLDEFRALSNELGIDTDSDIYNNKADKYATDKVRKDILDGCQMMEYKFNTIASSRGDFSFTTVSFGLGTDKWSKMMSEALLETRVNGQGDPAIPMLFPKLVFMTSLNHLHGEGMPNRDIFLKACETSNKVMYPDFVSLDYSDSNENYLGHIYEKYGKAIAPMGCRAYLSVLCVNKNTGEYSFKEEDPKEWDFIVEGRYNLGAYTLHLPLILAKSIEECGIDFNNRTYSESELSIIKASFYKNLTYYLDVIKELIIKTYNYIGDMPASVNPIMFTQGLAWRGNLKPTDKLKDILIGSTSSFGYTGLNELQALFNNKQLNEDGDFAYEVLQFISDYKDKTKVETGINTALYSTPSESLCSTQIKQFRAKYGVIKGVSDREYTTNSFHMPVWCDISPIQKQDLEERFFKIPTGGRIQYVRIPNSDNLEATTALIERGVRKGFYQGINLAKSYCDHGHEFFEGDSDGNSCPFCGSQKLTTINRVCGYLGYSRTFDGSTRMNDGKMAEIKDRRSM